MAYLFFIHYSFVCHYRYCNLLYQSKALFKFKDYFLFVLWLDNLHDSLDSWVRDIGGFSLNDSALMMTRRIV